MTDRNVYALNLVSGKVAKVDGDLLKHPVLGKNLMEVETPNVCITCGEQPKSVVTVEGETLDIQATHIPDPEPYGALGEDTETDEEL